jgi:hypothetical protein
MAKLDLEFTGPFFWQDYFGEEIKPEPEGDINDKFRANGADGVRRDFDRAYSKTNFSNGWRAIDSSKPVRPPHELIKGLLPRQGVGFIGGASGAGKSFVAVNLSICLASATPFFGYRVRKPVGVGYLATEGFESLDRRFRAAQIDTLGHVDPLPIITKGDAPALTEPKDVDSFAAELARLQGEMESRFGLPLGVLVMDTLAATFDLDDESDNSEAAKTMRKLHKLARAIDGLMFPVHHYGKNHTTGLRGASAWRGGADAIIAVNCERNEQTGQSDSRSLALAKYRDGAEGIISAFELQHFPLGVDADGDVFGSMVVRPTGGPIVAGCRPKDLREGAEDGRVMEALRQAIAEAGERAPGSNHIPQGVRVTTETTWRAYAYKLLTGGERTQQRVFKASMPRLIKRGLVGHWAPHVWVVK